MPLLEQIFLVLNGAGFLALAFFLGRAFQRIEDLAEKVKATETRVASIEHSPIALQVVELSVKVDHIRSDIQLVAQSLDEWRKLMRDHLMAIRPESVGLIG
jgi:hypothetical protein